MTWPLVVKTEALAPEGSNTIAVPRLATALLCAASAVSWHCVSTANTVAAILAEVEYRTRPAASLLLVDAISVNTAAKLLSDALSANARVCLAAFVVATSRDAIWVLSQTMYSSQDLSY